MSKVYVKPELHGFFGWRGQNVRLNAGDAYDLSDDIVTDHPEWFTAEAPDAEEQEKPRRRGRRG